jgi:hypothetical protein
MRMWTTAPWIIVLTLASVAAWADGRLPEPPRTRLDVTDLPPSGRTIAVAAGGDVVRWLRRHGVPIVVAAPGARTCPWDADLSGAVALVVGCEKRGVSPTWIEAADELVGIPMPGPAMDSLNVAAAAAVVLFEATRQRLSTG